MKQDVKSSLPRYQEVRRELMDEILGGGYEVGGTFPTDQELCARFDVSRHTVREALRELQREGLITRQQGFGTTVVATELRRRPYVLSLTTIDDIDIDANETGMELAFKGIVRLGTDLAVPAGREKGERWLRIAGLRRRRGEEAPQCWAEVLVAPAFAGIRNEVDGSKPIYQLIAEHYAVNPHAIQQVITGFTMPPHVRAALAPLTEEAGILVRRTYFGPDKEPFEIALSLYPASSFVNESWLHKERGGGRGAGKGGKRD